MNLIPMIAEATNEFAGQWLLMIGGFVANIVIAGVAIFSVLATRREVSAIEKRVEKLEESLDDKTSKLHKRVNRLLAGQMLIAGQVGVALDNQHDRLQEIMARLESEED